MHQGIPSAARSILRTALGIHGAAGRIPGATAHIPGDAPGIPSAAVCIPGAAGPISNAATRESAIKVTMFLFVDATKPS